MAGYSVELTVRSLPAIYAERVLKFVAPTMEGTRHVEFYLLWVQHLLTTHGQHLKQAGAQATPLLLSLQKSLNRRHEDLSKLYVFFWKSRVTVTLILLALLQL